MRTIRWRNGQCPGRNGQWAERIAHAGSEAVYSAARQTLIPLGGYPGHPALPLCAYARGAVGAYPCGTCPLTADSPCGAAAIS